MSLNDLLTALMRREIDLERIESDRPEGKTYSGAEVENGIATVGAILTLGCPFSSRANVLRAIVCFLENRNRK